MGYYNLTKANRLFWLGRYSERVMDIIAYCIPHYDQTIDGAPFDYSSFCYKLGISTDGWNKEEFLTDFLYNQDGGFSMKDAVDSMLGNGMVLRETIGSNKLAYLQMASNALMEAPGSDAPVLRLQWVIDDIRAFHGSLGEASLDESSRNIIQSGILLERISLYSRLEIHQETRKFEVQKLLDTLLKTNLTIKEFPKEQLYQYLFDEKDPPLFHDCDVAYAVENLVVFP